MMKQNLSYKNEDDKCYGAAGMTVGIVVLNGEEMLAAVNLDAAPGSIMEMEEIFYFNGNPGLSAKSAWNRIRDNFELSVAMLISNIMCRSIVLDKGNVNSDHRAAVREAVIEEGHDSCGLEEDEIARLFDRDYTALFRVFNHLGVQSVVHDFANTLKRRRRLSRMEILDELRVLSNL